MKNRYIVAVLTVTENDDKRARTHELLPDLVSYLDIKLTEEPSGQPQAPYWITDVTVFDPRTMYDQARVSNLIDRHRRAARRDRKGK